MRKRKEREEPCAVCGHYHNSEGGEACGICGHHDGPVPEQSMAQGDDFFPSVIIEGFLYLGSYHHASCCALLKTIGITRILNTVPSCENLYKINFMYYSLHDEKLLQFDDAIEYLEQCYNEKERVLVHCMSGRNRSPGIVIAYLMKSKRWRFAQSFQWVKERRQVIELSRDVQQQLLEFEQTIFGS